MRKKDLWSLELNNGGCLDVCKSYSIDILSDGTYHYKGTHNVKHIGKREGVFTQKQMKTYRELLGVIHWNELNDSYGSAANDSQLKEITFTLDSLTKRVLIYRLEPLELREVIRYIDELIDNDDF